MTPYDSVFARPAIEDVIFPGITADAAEHGMDVWNADEFLQLPSSRSLLDELSPADGAAPSPVSGVAALAFHGYHFWRHGRVSAGIAEAALREMTDAAAPPIGPWQIQADPPSGYIVLPPNLMWAATEGGTPEAVHGFFYALTLPPAAPRLDVLVALGLRPDRAGFTAIDLSVPLPAPDNGHFGDIHAREDGDDFANVLPGGELRGLLAVTNAGEVLKLVSRALHHLHPQSV